MKRTSVNGALENSDRFWDDGYLVKLWLHNYSFNYATFKVIKGFLVGIEWRMCVCECVAVLGF